MPVVRASRLQHRGQLRHQHELAGLRRRIDDELPGPDARADGAELRLGGDRHRGCHRADARPSRALERKTIGNFWVDLTRATLYVLLPLCIVIALVLVGSGMPQNLNAYVDATTLEGAKQVIAQGPVASQIAIKQLGTNGGGFFNANSAHPFENPDAISNLVEMWAIFAIGAALTYTFGRMVGDQRQGWALLAAMASCSSSASLVAYWAEAAGNPLLQRRRSTPPSAICSRRQHGGQGGPLRHRRTPRSGR